MDKTFTEKSLEAFVTKIEFSESEKKAFRELNASKYFKKGDILVEAGQILTQSFYVVQGCVRQYYLVDGEEKTTDFYTDNSSVISSNKSSNSEPCKFYLECTEDSHLKVTSYIQEAEIYSKFPRFEKLCRITTEKTLGAYQERFALFMTSTPEERYKNLVETRPDLLHRVPQYQLASYLGIQPESLSRIRKRLMEKI